MPYCKDCYRDDTYKNKDAYVRSHMSTSNLNKLCDVCGQLKPVVVKIDASELYPVENGQTILKLYNKGLLRGCPACGTLFTQKDAVVSSQTEKCPKCGCILDYVWTIRPVAHIRRKLKEKIADLKEKQKRR